MMGYATKRFAVFTCATSAKDAVLVDFRATSTLMHIRSSPVAQAGWPLLTPATAMAEKFVQLLILLLTRPNNGTESVAV